MYHRLFLFIVLLFSGSLSLPLFAEEPDASRFSSEVVVLTSPGEPVELLQRHLERQELFEAFSLRGTRFLLSFLDQQLVPQPVGLKIMAAVFLFLTALLILATLLSRKKSLMLIIALLVLPLSPLFWLASIAKQELQDFDDTLPVARQNIWSAVSGLGLSFSIHDDWNVFVREFQGTEAAIIWNGYPKGSTDEKIMEMFRVNSPYVKSGSVFASIGALLPPVFLNGLTDPNDNSAIYLYGESLVVHTKAEDSSLRFAQALKRALLRNNRSCFAFPALDKKVVLRMDDPGSAQNANLERWLHSELDLETWKREVEKPLSSLGYTMSVGYVPGWKDSGQGELKVGQQDVKNREPGKVYPSHQVQAKMSDKLQYRPDLQAEFLASSRSFDLELHGYTHISPVREWLSADDRFEEPRWYREFFVTWEQPRRPADEVHQRDMIEKSLALFRQVTSTPPSTFIPPGHAYSPDTAPIAFSYDFLLMADRSVSVMYEKAILRSDLIPAVSIDGTEPVFVPDSFEAGFPFMAYLHDRDIAIEDFGWFDGRIRELRLLGAKRLITLRELALRLLLIPLAERNAKTEELKLSVNVSERILPHLFALPNGELDFQLHLPPKRKPAFSGNFRVLSFNASDNSYHVAWKLDTENPGMQSITVPLRPGK